MNCHRFIILCGIVFLILLPPAVSAVDPLWTERATTSGELSGVVISADGSTIVAGGDQLIALSRNGKKLWTGWSGSSLAVSRNGNYIVSARGDTFRLISGTGTLLWDEPLGVPVADVSMTPDASLIAAGGVTRVKVMNGSGTGVKLNTSLHVNHLRLFPEGDRVVVTSKEGVQTSNITLYTVWADTNVTQDFVEIAANGSSFVTVTNNRIRSYARDGSLRWDRALPGGNALSSAYSGDGSTVVVGRDDNTLTILDSNGTVLWTARAAHWVTSVAVSDDGNTIAAGSMDRTLSVYDREGTKLGSFTAGEPIKARSVAVSSDGSVIAAVDASNVYGFSRSQFTQPATPVPSPTVTSEETTLPPPAATTTVTPPPPTTVTPKAALPLALALLAPGLLLLCRLRKP